MSSDSKIQIITESNECVSASAPVVVSASRSTDIPAFYCDWFFHRLKKGYSVWTNPFNGAKMYVSYAKTRFIVFWSKNPRPLLKHLDELKDMGIKCYVQYSLNDYEDERLETGVPPLEQRIETFKLLVDKLGFGGVVWRFDPLMLTDDIDIEKLLVKIANIGDQLKGYTEKLVFSYADIALYKKVKTNLENSKIPYKEWTKEQMIEMAKRIVEINKERSWNYTLATCSEAADLDGIEHNHCVDDALMIRRGYDDPDLMAYLKAELHLMPMVDLFGKSNPLPKGAILLGSGMYAIRGNNKDKGQREFCGCTKSKDIGQYDTCIHKCEYCYANTNKESALRNYKWHLQNSEKETIK